jgi:hypothetical protein
VPHVFVHKFIQSLPELGSGSRPTLLIAHELPDSRGHRVSLECGLGGVTPIARVGCHERAGLPPQALLSRRSPHREISHAGHPFEPYTLDHPQSARNRVVERSEDRGAGPLEITQEHGLWSAIPLGYRRQSDNQTPVQEVGPSRHLSYAVEDDWTGGVEEDLFGIGVELAGAEAAASA